MTVDDSESILKPAEILLTRAGRGPAHSRRPCQTREPDPQCGKLQPDPAISPERTRPVPRPRVSSQSAGITRPGDSLSLCLLPDDSIMPVLLKVEDLPGRRFPAYPE